MQSFIIKTLSTHTAVLWTLTMNPICFVVKPMKYIYRIFIAIVQHRLNLPHYLLCGDLLYESNIKLMKLGLNQLIKLHAVLIY